MNRRDFLGSAAAATLASTALLADDRPAARLFPFGFSLYGAPGIAPSVALPALARIGYDCVELSCLSGWPTEPKSLPPAARQQLRKLLEDNGLALASLMENLPEPAEDSKHRSHLERLRAACELGHELSPREAPVVETILGQKPAQWPEVKQRMVERLADWAAVAEKQQTVIALKPHVGNALHTPEDALWLLKQVNSPWLKLAYDYSHYVLRGLPMETTIAAIAPQSSFVHIKDARGTPENFEFLLPGEAGLDYQKLFRLLHASGYRGSVVVEVSSQLSKRPDYDWLAAAERSFKNLSAALAR